MQLFLMQVNFLPDFCDALNQNPHDYIAPMRAAANRLGGDIEGAWAAFGIADLIMIVHMTDNVHAAAFSQALLISGAVNSINTTPLVTLEDERKAMSLAPIAKYHPPNS